MRRTYKTGSTQTTGEVVHQSATAQRPALSLQIDVLEPRIAPGAPVLEFGGPSNLSPQNAFLPTGYLKY